MTYSLNIMNNELQIFSQLFCFLEFYMILILESFCILVQNI